MITLVRFCDERAPPAAGEFRFSTPIGGLAARFEDDGVANAVSALREWLLAYFGGENPPVTQHLCPAGTAFQHLVWECLREIPYGETATYGEIARRVAARRKDSGTAGQIPSARAVGGACGKNPIALLIPCHRVIGAHGELTGYAGGIERKKALLTLEKAGTTISKKN